MSIWRNPRAARSRTLLQRLDASDLALFQRVATAETPVLDRVLPRLTTSADHGLLWFGVAAALAAAGQRKAAIRGLGSLTVASAVANLPAKYAVRRTRPQWSTVPLPRHLRRQPQSSSFPSGHSASAAAFAVGVALECPPLAVPVGLLASGVAYGRVYTGVHYPGDVAAGVAFGVGSALLVRRLWPVHKDAPAIAPPPRRPTPALPDGAGLIVVINQGAGSADQADDVEKQLGVELPQAEVIRCDSGGDIKQALVEAASRAKALGVMGGDGTVNCAAAVALEHDLPLAVVPGGTLNHFAGELGLCDVSQVIAAVREGNAVEVSVGSATADGKGLYFLNTFALGVYPEIVERRERREKALGKWPAMALATARTMRKAQPLEVEVDGSRRSLWTLFAGNGRYHPEGFVPSWREHLDEDCIDVRLISAERPLSRLRVTLALIAGQLARSAAYEEKVVESLKVEGDEPLTLARDGEVGDGPSRLTLRAASRKLVVYL